MIFDKPLSAYIAFAAPFMILTPLVGIVRLVLSLNGHNERWLSMTAVGFIGLLYFAIRMHTSGFGGYKQLLVPAFLQNMMSQFVSIAAIVIAIQTATDNIYSLPEAFGGEDGKSWMHVAAHATLGMIVGTLVAWGFSCLVLVLTRRWSTAVLTEGNLKGILKWPLVLAAAVTILRVIVERVGAPDRVSNLFSVVALHLVVVPIYIAIRLAISGIENPFRQHFKLVFIYVVLARAMVIPTYWLARVYHWTDSRFNGTWGDKVTPFLGIVGVPFGTALVWIVSSTIIGGALGSILIAATRQKLRKESTAH